MVSRSRDKSHLVLSNLLLVDRVAWFQDVVNEIEDKEKDLANEQVQGFASEYVQRSEEDIAELKAQRRPGRPSSKEEDRLNQQQEADKREFKSGLWVPDIRLQANREKLERWNGEWSGMNTLNFIRVSTDGSIKESSFPPKGLS